MSYNFRFDLFCYTNHSLIYHHHNETELKEGGFTLRHNGVLCFARYKYPMKNIKVLSRSNIIARLLKVEFKDEKKLREHTRRDCHEIRHLVKGTGTVLEEILDDQEGMYHMTPLMIEEMERTDDDIEKNAIHVMPAFDLEKQTRSSLSLNAMRSQHRDVYLTGRALHAYRIIQSRIKHTPKAKMMLLELDTSLVSVYPVGLTLGGHWRGADGLYKSARSVPIKRVVFIQLGSKGNLSDDDAEIVLVRDNGNMDKVVSINLKSGIGDFNEHSERYNGGTLRINEEEIEDDESIGQEETVFGMTVPPLENNNGNDGVQEPDNIEIAANDMIDRASDEIGGLTELTFSSLAQSTQRLNRKKLKKAFESAEKHWVHHLVSKVRVWIENRTKASQKVIPILVDLGYTIEPDLSINYEDGTVSRSLCLQKGLLQQV